MRRSSFLTLHSCSGGILYKFLIHKVYHQRKIVIAVTWHKHILLLHIFIKQVTCKDGDKRYTDRHPKDKNMEILKKVSTRVLGYPEKANINGIVTLNRTKRHLTPQIIVWFEYWNRVIHHHHIPHIHTISICMENGIILPKFI